MRVVRSLFRVLSTALIGLSLVGCATRTYLGPELPKEKIAIVRAGFVAEAFGARELVIIEKVDGRETHSLQPYIYEVEPGEREFDLLVLLGGPPLFVLAAGGPDRMRMPLKLRVEAGLEYRILAKRNPSPPPAYHVWMEDTRTNSVIAGSKPSPEIKP